jgi:hypothetical protein
MKKLIRQFSVDRPAISKNNFLSFPPSAQASTGRYLDLRPNLNSLASRFFARSQVRKNATGHRREGDSVASISESEQRAGKSPVGADIGKSIFRLSKCPSPRGGQFPLRVGKQFAYLPG